MMIKAKTLGNSLLIFGIVISSISRLDAEPLPLENLFKTPRYLQASLSPDGQHVGFIGFLNDSYELFTLNLNTKKIFGTRTGMGLNIRRFYWADNENLIFTVTKWGQYSYGMYSVHRDGKPLRTLIEIGSYASILDLQDDVPNESLIQLGWNVYRINYLKDVRQQGPMYPSLVTYRLKVENPGDEGGYPLWGSCPCVTNFYLDSAESIRSLFFHSSHHLHGDDEVSVMKTKKEQNLMSGYYINGRSVVHKCREMTAEAGKIEPFGKEWIIWLKDWDNGKYYNAGQCHYSSYEEACGKLLENPLLSGISSKMVRPYFKTKT